MKTLQTAISLALLLTLSSTVGVNTSFAQESGTTPSYINSRTGEPAQLISAYWDGNADLVGRDIVCQQFSTSGETGFITEFRWYRFLPIPAGSVSGFYYSANTQEELTPDATEVPFLWDWFVIDGRLRSNSNIEISVGHFPGAAPGFSHSDDWDLYLSPGADFGSRNHRFVEPFINNDGVQAIRFYETSGSHFSVFIDYTECSDSSGQPFGPTGSPDRPATTAPSPYVETPLLFTGRQEPEPTVVHRETGLQVNFETGTWDAQTDIVDRSITCTTHVYHEPSSLYVTGFNGGSTTRSHYEPRIIGFAENSGARIDLFEGRYFYREWSVTGNDGIGISRSQWYEPITRSNNQEGVRYWAPGGGSYTDCYATDANGPVASFRPQSNTTDIENEIASCDYTDAHLYGGWGWNAATSESCEPLTDINPDINNGCDYSDADLYGGWGWNATTGESCAPVQLNSGSGDIPGTQSNACIDSDGDGWGWDGVSSCQVSTSNPTSSNNPESGNSACIDTDGDGWGWNSSTSTSCRI